MFSEKDFQKTGSESSVYKTMDIGDIKHMCFEEGYEKAIAFQRNAHAYGRMYSMKFKTKTTTKDGKKYMVVMRTK